MKVIVFQWPHGTSDRGLAPRRAQPRHVGFGPGLVDEHQPCGINAMLVAAPLIPSPGDAGPILLGGDEGFYR